ncbi:MAG: hypothetical protein WCI27_00195 [Candidatus Omnitrophota bacterium]
MNKNIAGLILVILFVGSSLCEAMRFPPAKIEPVYYKGVVFIAPNNGSRQGYVEAWDFKASKKLWEKNFYKIVIDPTLESDAQEVYIKSLNVSDGRLIVVNERSQKFEEAVPKEILKNSDDFKMIQIAMYYSFSVNFSYVHYGDLGLFVNGIDCAKDMDKFKKQLKKTFAVNPGALYEFKSDWKLTAMDMIKYRAAIQEAGIRLEHFWVPASDNSNPDDQGSYSGLVDILMK